MRLFIALDLPDETRERLATLMNGLPGARWLPPENLHLTLRFVGEVDNRVGNDIHDMLMGIRVPAFELTLDGIGTFNEGRRLRSLWVGVQANEILIRLQAKVEQAVRRAGLPPEKRKFKPHVTLARFKADPPGDKLHAFLQANSLFRCAPLTVEKFVLFSSFLSHSGALYRPEESYPLEYVTAGL